jgi:hypothetical protein
LQRNHCWQIHQATELVLTAMSVYYEYNLSVQYLKQHRKGFSVYRSNMTYSKRI